MKCPSKNLIAAAVAAAMVPAAHAAKVEVAVSGQVNRAVTYADNGNNDDILHVDNNSSGTRVRLTGNADMGNGNKVGVYWETQYQDNSSSAIDIGSSDNASTFSSRFREAWFSGSWGKLYIGQGNGSANGTLESDLSGLFIVSNADTNLGDGVQFEDDAGNKLGGSGLGGTDGLSRNDRLRYDTPALGPLVVSVDTGQEKFEVAARVSQKFGGGGKFATAIGYVDSDTDDDTGASGVASFDGSQISLSGSILLGNGLNLTGAYGMRDLDDSRGPGDDDPTTIYLKLGYMTGPHHFGVSYRTREDLSAVGEDREEFGVMYLHKLADHGVELYVGAFQRTEDGLRGPTGLSAEDVTLIHAGTRVKF